MKRYNIAWHERVDHFWNSVATHIEKTEVVLDIGSGIVPMNYFRPCLHILLEPYKEYVDILIHRHIDDKSIFIISGTAQEVLPYFTANSIDSVFLLDVIEHFEKEDGYALLRQAERIARKQIVVITPLGFMPQHAEADEADGWGLSGTAYQEHRSGWLPEDFGFDWTFHICETAHQYDFRQEKLPEPYGALFASKTFTDHVAPIPAKLVDLRRPLPSEIALEQTQAALAQTEAELADARRILNQPLIRLQRKAWRLMKFWN